MTFSDTKVLRARETCISGNTKRMGATAGSPPFALFTKNGIPRYAIFENLESGARLDDIMEWYDGLDREQVRAVIEFAARSLDKAPVLATSFFCERI